MFMDKCVCVCVCVCVCEQYVCACVRACVCVYVWIFSILLFSFQRVYVSTLFKTAGLYSVSLASSLGITEELEEGNSFNLNFSTIAFYIFKVSFSCPKMNLSLSLYIYFLPFPFEILFILFENQEQGL